MIPSELSLFASYGTLAIAHDGSVIVSRSTPDVTADEYREVLERVGETTSGAAADPTAVTYGPHDAAPVTSPDGRHLAFLRGGQRGPKQLYVMPLDGGEARLVATHPLGVSSPVFSPDGRRIAYLAAVPEAGRYGTAPDDDGGVEASGAAAGDGAATVGPEAEPPRLISRLSYRSDGKGFTVDKADQIFVVDVVDARGAPILDPTPTLLTAEVGPVGRPAFMSDGSGVVYTRPTDIDAIRSEIASVAIGSASPDVGSTLVAIPGDAALPVVAGDTVYFYGTEFDGYRMAGETPGLWAAPVSGGAARRLTDRLTVHIEVSAGPCTVLGNSVLIPVADRGSVSLRTVPIEAESVPLHDLVAVIDGHSVVRSFAVRGGQLAAVVADAGSTGDVVVVDLDDAAASPRRVTDISAPLRGAGLGEVVELGGTGVDGYPLHGWLVLPSSRVGDGPHPVLLDVHGGPHAAYTWAVFDEAQMYAAQGYAVVLPNPRGSAGYGLGHGQTIVGRLGTVDAADVLAVLDLALEHPTVGDHLDATRVGIMGGSYGGFMTSWLASQAPERFVAGISERAVNAWDSFAGTSDIGYFFAEAYVGADRDEQWARSPLAHVDQISIPLLIIHSEQDWRCPLEQGQRLYTALKRRGHETEFLLFPGEGHELSRSGRPRHRQQRFEAILQWWSRYLPVREAPV